MTRVARRNAGPPASVSGVRGACVIAPHRRPMAVAYLAMASHQLSASGFPGTLGAKFTALLDSLTL